jgi:hypothetical protein
LRSLRHDIPLVALLKNHHRTGLQNLTKLALGR